jgi:phosphatidylserine/phosphatidylglycerophosphate/cardiolipin synthase-like enzyme
VIGDLVGQVDAVLGEGVEHVVRAHHRRRLTRVGRIEQLDPPDGGAPWCARDFAPQEGCAVEMLIDGATALPAVAEAIRSARSHVHIAGWHLQPDFAITRGAGRETLRELLGAAAAKVDVRVLLWAGAPFPVFTPSRARVRRERERLVAGTRVRCALDARERPMHCHHEKLVIVDDEAAFVGGIDLTALGGDRFDSDAHPLRSGIGWHDVAARVRGPVVADVASHFRARWHEVTGEQLAAPAPSGVAGPHRVQLVRTVPERVYGFARDGEFGILEAYTRALRSARRLIYLESQFLWSPHVVEILAAKLREPPSEQFRLVVVLPTRPNNGRDMTRGQLGVLADADAANEPRRFLAATLCSQTPPRTGPLYVHAKVGIVDDECLTVGSANLNEHSFLNDTEVNLLCCEPELVRETRLALWSEHLQRSSAEVSGEPAAVVDELWRPIAQEQLERRRRDDTQTHRLVELPGVSRRAMALRGPLDGLFVDG